MMYVCMQLKWYVCMMHEHAWVSVETKLNGVIIGGGDDVMFTKERGEAFGEWDGWYVEGIITMSAYTYH